MLKQTRYVQCVLKRENIIQTGWIPECYAITGKSLKLFDDNVWQNGWKVMSKGVKISQENLELLSKNYKNTKAFRVT